MAQVVSEETLAAARERVRNTTAAEAVAGYYRGILSSVGLEPHQVPGGWMFGAEVLFVPVDDEILATFAAWYTLR